MERLFRRNVPLKEHCTYGTGGPAAWFFEPENLSGLEKAVAWAKKSGVPFFLLGNGSNVLISDKGFPGLVICTVSRLDRILFEGDKVEAECGASLCGLVEACCAKGLSGLENLYDIPGSVGGALYMNAGAFDAAISDCVAEVVSLDQSGVIRKRKREALLFNYRDSTFRRESEIILNGTFSLKRREPAGLLESMKAIKARRDEKQPPDRDKSCGSVFKRPPGGFAGSLIEKSGLKGLRIGGAKVSEKHANFIINEKRATAGEIKTLIDTVQAKVLEKTGVKLEPEVVFLGEF